jgi:spore germination protein KC
MDSQEGDKEKSMRRFKILIISLLLTNIILLAGCWDQKHLESLEFVLTLGIDEGSNGKIKYTNDYLLIAAGKGSEEGSNSSNSNGSSADSSGDIRYSVNEAYLGREAIELENLSSPLELGEGKLQTVLVGKDFAESRGIANFMETHERDTRFTVQAFIGIVDGEASELIIKGSDLQKSPKLGIYLKSLLDRNHKRGYCPQVSIIEYDIISSTPGRCTFVPLVKLEGDEIRVVGSALISDDRMTGQIDNHETACVFIAMGEKRDSSILFDLPEGIRDKDNKKGMVSVQKLKSKRKLDLSGEVAKVTFDIKIDFHMREYKWGNITDPAYQKKIEGSINEAIQSCLDETFKKLQEAKCDIFCLGAEVRAFHHDYWLSVGGLEGWEDVYQEMDVSFNVQSRIVRIGDVR